MRELSLSNWPIVPPNIFSHKIYHLRERHNLNSIVSKKKIFSMGHFSNFFYFGCHVSDYVSVMLFKIHNHLFPRRDWNRWPYRRWYDASDPMTTSACSIVSNRKKKNVVTKEIGFSRTIKPSLFISIYFSLILSRRCVCLLILPLFLSAILSSAPCQYISYIVVTIMLNSFLCSCLLFPTLFMFCLLYLAFSYYISSLFSIFSFSFIFTFWNHPIFFNQTSKQTPGKRIILMLVMIICLLISFSKVFYLYFK